MVGFFKRFSVDDGLPLLLGECRKDPPNRPEIICERRDQGSRDRAENVFRPIRKTPVLALLGESV